MSIARGELFACRYKKAAELFAQLVSKNASDGESWLGLVRAQIELDQPSRAYASAEEALRNAPQTAGAQCAAGFAAYRRGEITKEEQLFLAAYKIDNQHAGALSGLARINYCVSMRRRSRNLALTAWRLSPDDPDLALAHAESLHGPARLAALEQLLSRLDPESEIAKTLRARIADEAVYGDRKLRVLTSPYQSSRIKMVKIMRDYSHSRGVGLKVVLNQSEKVTLLLDNGAFGISLSPKTAEKARLLPAGAESSESRGIGDGRAQPARHYLVQGVQIGDVAFSSYPVGIFESARSSDYDGIIGADVFKQFIITLDFPRLTMSLEPRGSQPSDADALVDAAAVAPIGFRRIFRFGDHLGLSTMVNKKTQSIFLIDSGAASNFIDTDLARASTSVSDNPRIAIRGIQGRVNHVSLTDRIALDFAGFHQDNPNLIAFSMEAISNRMGVAFGGILGMPVLEQLRLTIDYQEGAIRLEHDQH